MSTCAECLHFDGDCETTHIEIAGRWREVYLHRCQKHPERINGDAVHEECFVSRADAERKTRGFDKPVESTTGFSQGELL